MPVADYNTYCGMLNRARAARFALPAVNVTSLTTAHAVLRGLAESKADGIIQISTGGGAFASGTTIKDSAMGAISIAEHTAGFHYRIFFTAGGGKPNGAMQATASLNMLPRTLTKSSLERPSRYHFNQRRLPFGRLWHGEPDPITNAVGYAKFLNCSHDAVIRVYDERMMRMALQSRSCPVSFAVAT